MQVPGEEKSMLGKNEHGFTRKDDLLHWQADSLPLSHLGCRLFLLSPFSALKNKCQIKQAGLLPCPGYYKQCCDEHWGTRVSFNSGFLSVYTQQWDCWIIRQFSLLWMWPTWFLGWERLRIFSLRVGRIVSFSEILLSNRVVIDTSSRWGEEHAGEEWAWVHQERWSPVFPQNAKLIWVFSYHSVMNHR